MSIAHEHLVNFFGVQVAERLLGVAQEMGLFQGDPDEYEGEEDANKNTYN